MQWYRNVTLLMVIYLLFTLILIVMIVNIVSLKIAPLQSN